MTFTAEQNAALAANLDKGRVATRKQAGRELSYIEGWWAISEANRIFGFDGWSSETVDIRCVSERERKIGKDNYAKDGWGVSYVARVRIVVGGVVREGVGAGHGIDADLGQAHESAIKEAETDARKRGLMTFGNPFGLALYDKTQANVGEVQETPRKPTPIKAETVMEDTAKRIEHSREATDQWLDQLRQFYQQVTRNSVPLAHVRSDLATWEKMRATFWSEITPKDQERVSQALSKVNSAIAAKGKAAA